MYKTVLLPIDINHEASWTKALPAAKGLLDDGGALHVLCVVPDFGAAIVAGHFPDGFEKEMLQGAKDALDAFAAKHAPGATVHVGHGHVPEAILKAAGAAGAEAIVMASHPPDELRTLFVGSNAAKVVRHAEIPVLVVR